jgi:hypothetical protein
MNRIHPRKIRLPCQQRWAHYYVTSYYVEPHRFRCRQISRAARPLAPPHISTRTWPEHAPRRSFRFASSFLLPALATCQRRCPVRDRCQHNLRAATFLLPQGRIQRVPASSECCLAGRCRQPAADGSSHRPVGPATLQSCGSMSCFRRSRATPESPSTPQSRRCRFRILSFDPQVNLHRLANRVARVPSIAQRLT